MEIIALDNKGLANIPIYIKPKEKHIPRRTYFKLDTGASITTISKNMLNSLGYCDDWIKSNSTNGPIKEISSAGRGYELAYCVILPYSTILGKVLNNWPFYIRPEDDRDYRNLLGVDILSNFKFTFCYNTGYVNIEAINDPYINFPMLPHQKIDELDINN
ncbi:MAG: retroviral-like aspartic protease family protein [Oscillospiraceae bacterium]|jgi:hypothetical protein|nr:retroviral-like aspartic protease family protein [Oscillospiraceae bacterium]